MSVAALFPGQGSQFVGMGADLFDSSSGLLGDSVDEILGWSLRDVCLNGPEEKLTRTEYAQPALFALSYALYNEAEHSGLTVAAAAGHSLGEYTALVANKSMSFDDALRVVARRGRAMAAAADLEPSGMAALIGADESLASEVVAANNQSGGRLQVANLNAPGQVVVAGAASDLEWLADNARDLGVRRAIPLKVGGAFHSSFMQPAADDVGKALEDVGFGEPSFSVWSNTTAARHTTAELALTLAAQVISPVRFQESLENMAAAGTDVFVHVGPGDVTAGMAKRSVPDAEVHVISSPEDIGSVVAAVGTMQ